MFNCGRDSPRTIAMQRRHLSCLYSVPFVTSNPHICSLIMQGAGHVQTDLRQQEARSDCGLFGERNSAAELISKPQS
jgi:hypothetical protein